MNDLFTTRRLWLTVTLALGLSFVQAQTVKIGETTYPSISDALVASVDGDTILITGIHTDTLSISKSVTLMGTDPTMDIIQADATPGTGPKRVITVEAEGDSLIINIENLGIRYGKAAANGGGINIDKNQGMVKLKNLIIEENTTGKNGGGVSAAGSNLDMIDCIIRNNSSNLDGGGIIVAPNNGVSIDPQINILGCLIDGNNSRHAGGIFINGNKDFGNDHLIDVYVENSTISNNVGSGGAGGAGGGALWSKCAFWTVDGTTGNVSLTMVHSTVYNNFHSSAIKSGLQFTSAPAGAMTNFQLFNSIVVSSNDLSIKAVNFANTNTLDVLNCLLGGLNAAPALFNDTTKNNKIGRTATFVGMDSVLSNQGGATQLFALPEGATAVDFCIVPVTSITLPIADARGVMRDSSPDAGAFEFFVPNTAPSVANTVSDTTVEEGFGSIVLDLSATFSDVDGDSLTLSSDVAGTGVVTASLSDFNLTLTEAGALGEDSITVTASDGRGGTANISFVVTVEASSTSILRELSRQVIKLFPNPVTSQLYVEMEAGFPIDDIQIVDLRGRVMAVEALNSAGLLTINLDQLESGYYFLKIHSRDQWYADGFIKQ